MLKCTKNIEFGKVFGGRYLELFKKTILLHSLSQLISIVLFLVLSLLSCFVTFPVMFSIVKFRHSLQCNDGN